MYSSFSIRNFKLFKEFTIDNLERVNLVTGRNNAGKTSLLEALFIHSGAANVHLPFTIEALRGVTQVKTNLDNALSGLFTGFQTTPTIEFSALDKLSIRRICRLRLIAVPTVVEPGAEESTTRGQGIEITFTDEATRQQASSKAVLEKGDLRLDPLPIPPAYRGVFIATKNTNHKADADRYSELVKIVGEEERFLRAMEVVEPDLRSIRLLNHGGMSMMHADVGLGRFLPLAYAGEGMVRLASILAAMATSRNGVVFIDEFENGVHYTLLPRIWTAVGEFATAFNVQVFATTHSAECVRAAHDSFAASDYALRVFRLERRPGAGIDVKTFDREALAAALKSELDVR